ncbi:hypothetical protein ACFLSX_03345 [Calditrichota bacterium]
MKKLVFIVLITITNIPLNAQLSDWEYGGYVKNLAAYIDGTYEGLPADIGKFKNIFQGRLNLDWYPIYELSFCAQSRHLFTYQKNYYLTTGFFTQLSRSSYYFDLTWEAIEEKDYTYLSEFDRLNMLWSTGDLEITLGRQRIAWGTCLVWNPTDLFNAANILDFDYPERLGTDAVKMQYYIDETSAIEIAFSPGKTAEEVIYAGRYKTNFWNYDFSLLAGWQLNTLRIGGSWAGDIIGGGFRGELVYSKPDIKAALPIDPALAAFSSPGFIPKLIIDNLYWTAALSYDYTFENSLYLHTEWLYNELGATEKSGSRRIETLYTGELSSSRYSLFFEIAYDMTPLFRSDIFFIVNPTDGSWIAAPSFTYSVATNWEIYLLAFPSEGKSGSEFDGFPAQYFLRAQYSF